MTMNSDPDREGPHVPARQRPSITRVVMHSMLFGAIFVPIVLAVLYLGMLVEWSPWTTPMFYDTCGFPCIGLFAIMSASFCVMRLCRRKFSTSLTMVSIGAVLCWVISGNLDVMPKMYKGLGLEPHWQRPEFIAWLFLPPWIVAVVIIGIVSAKRRASKDSLMF
jgi:hypothetical protein